jgi:hypothetical protein
MAAQALEGGAEQQGEGRALNLSCRFGRGPRLPRGPGDRFWLSRSVEASCGGTGSEGASIVLGSKPGAVLQAGLVAAFVETGFDTDPPDDARLAL